jgi:transposase-like protein
MYTLFIFSRVKLQNYIKSNPINRLKKREEEVMLLCGNGLRFSPKRLYHCKRVSAFLIDETMLQIGSSNEAWLWVAVVEPIHKQILGVYISRHRNMIVVESFLRSLLRIYGKHTVYSDGGCWYPEACVSLGLKHRLHSSYGKSIVEKEL